MTPDQRAQITYRNERWRSLCAGILETAGNTFMLLLAVRYFQAGAMTKALVAGGGSCGLLLSPLVVNGTQRLGWPATVAGSRILLLGSLACLAAAFSPLRATWLYAGGCVLALTTAASVIPLMTQVYQDNYPAEQRGQLYSRTFMLRILAALIFGFLGGQWLEPDPWMRVRLPGLTGHIAEFPERFRVLLLVFAAALGAASWVVHRIPSQPLRYDVGSHPLAGLRFVRTDRWFRQALIAWMLMGFANLAMLPMRVEYLGNPRYGLMKTAAEIALLTLVIPNAARLVLSPIWGWFFDRMNFFALRIVLNLGFALGIASFFTSNSWAGLIAAAVIYGISNAGGDVAWGLWVTKFAPSHHVAEYMAVHTFMTGVRGVLAPVVAFQVVQHYTPQTMGWIAGAMILAASAVLLPEIWSWPARARGDRSVEPAED